MAKKKYLYNTEKNAYVEITDDNKAAIKEKYNSNPSLYKIYEYDESQEVDSAKKPVTPSESLDVKSQAGSSPSKGVETISLEKSFSHQATPEYAKNVRSKTIDKNEEAYTNALNESTNNLIELDKAMRGIVEQQEELGVLIDRVEKAPLPLPSVGQGYRDALESYNTGVAAANQNVEQINQLGEEYGNLVEQYNQELKRNQGLRLGKAQYEEIKSEEAENLRNKILSEHKKVLDKLPLQQRVGSFVLGGALFGAKNIASSVMAAMGTIKPSITQEEIDAMPDGDIKDLFKKNREEELRGAKEMYEKSKEWRESAEKTEQEYGLVSNLNQLGESGYNPMDVINFAVTSAAEQLPQIPLAAATFGVSTYEQTTGSIMAAVIDEVVKDNMSNGMGEEEAFLAALEDPRINRGAVELSSIGVAALDLLGASKLVSGIGKKNIQKHLSNQIKANAAKKFAGGVITEEATEIGQEYIESGAKRAALSENTLEGFIDGMGDITTDDLKNIAAKTLFGAGGFSAVNAYSQDGKINSENVNMLVKAAKDDQVLKNIEEQITLKRINGDLTEEQANERIAQLADDIEIMSSIPKEVAEEDMLEAYDLVKKYNQAKADQEQASSAFRGLYNEEIKGYEENLQDLIKNPNRATRRANEKQAKLSEETNSLFTESTEKLSPTIDPILKRMDGGEYINDNEIDVALNDVMNEIERIEGSEYSPQAKKETLDLLYDLADQIDDYEFRTTEKTETVTKGRPEQRPRKAIQKPQAEDFFKGTQAILNDEDVVTFDKDGETTVVKFAKDTGKEPIAIETASLEITGREFDDNTGGIKSVELTDMNGNRIKISGEQAMDLSIKDRQSKIGEVPQSVFDAIVEEEIRVYEEKYNKTKPIEDAKKQQSGEMREQGKPQETEGTGDSNLSEVNETELQDGTKEKKIEDAAKIIADRFRDARFVKTQKDLANLQSDPTGLFKVAWDGSMVAVANVIEAGGTVAQAISDGVKSLKESDWYRSLSEDGKKKAVKTFQNDFKKSAKEMSKQRNKSLKDINKKARTIKQKLKKGKFYNRSIEVAQFIASLSNLGNVKSPELLQRISDELSAISRVGIADIKADRINELSKEVSAQAPIEDKRTSFERAKAKMSSLKQAAKNVKDLTSLVKFAAASDEAMYEYDSALTNGEITEEQYDKAVNEIESYQSALSDIDSQTKDSYSAIIAGKGDITRTKNKIQKALDEGKITQERADQLLSGLDGAKEQYESEVGKYIDGVNNKVKKYLSNTSSKEVSEVFGLSKPETVLIEKLFDVFRRGDIRIEDIGLADRMDKIIDSIDEGFFPLKDIYNAYRKVLSDRNSQEVVSVINDSVRSMKNKSTAEILTDFSTTVMGFRSSKLGKRVKDSQVLEKNVYSPLLQAIEQAQNETDNILREFDNATKIKWYDRIIPSAKKKRRRNIIMAGVYMNQMNNWIRRNDGETTGIYIKNQDDSKVDVGSIDWLGIILGKEAAINAMEGEINPTSKKALLNGELKKEYGASDLKYMEEVWGSLPKKTDGSVNWDEFFENNERYMDKEASNLAVAASDAFDSAYSFIRAAKGMRGEPVDNIAGYYKRARLGINDADIDYRTLNFTSNMRVVAGSSIDRTTDAVGAIDFNVINTVVANSAEAPKFFMFEMNGGLVNSTMNKVIFYSENKSIAAAIKSDAKQAINFTYSTHTKGAERFISKMVGAKYAATLLRPLRIVAEGVSMFTRAYFQTGVNPMKNVFNQKSLSKLEDISGIKITPTQSAQMEQGVMTPLRKMSRKSLSAQKRKGVSELLNMAGGLAEISLSAAYSIPIFQKNFKSISGNDIDLKNLNDPQWVEENKQAITEAMALAKIEMGRLYPTGNKFAERRKIKLIPFTNKANVDIDSPFGKIMNYMSTFVFKESETLLESAKFAAQELSEQGYTGKGAMAAATQFFTSKESRAALGVILGSYVYTYATGLEYILSGLLLSDDGDDEEKYRDMLKEQYGLRLNRDNDIVDFDPLNSVVGELGMMGQSIPFFFIGRYGQAVRTLSVLGLSSLYSATKDKKLQNTIETTMMDNLYVRPVDLNKYGVGAYTVKSVPVLDMGVNTFVGLADATKLAGEIVEKRATGKKITERDKEYLKYFNLSYKLINLGLISKGTQLPESRRTNRALEKELSEKKSKGGSFRVLN